jgi:hypothetical protein
VELTAVCDEEAEHGLWLHYSYGNEYIKNGQYGGSAEFVEITRARAKAAARRAGWIIPTKSSDRTLCPHHAKGRHK